MLDLAGDRTRGCAVVDGIATRHLAAIDRKLADLSRLRDRLAQIIASCAGGTLDECRILEALDPGPAGND